MKKIYNVRLLLLTAMVAIVSLFACKKDSASTNSGETELLSFGPTGAMPGDTIRFYGNNLDKVTDIMFKGASVTSANFVSKSSSEIYVKVPTQTEKGFVTLKTPTGDITSKTEFNIAVAVVVTSVTSQARPGTNISIKGDYLNWVNSVTFNNGKVVTTFVSQTKTELQLTVPADAQTGTLVLTYAGTNPSKLETKDTMRVTLPVITALSPSPITHAAQLTITGTNLDLTKSVSFSGVATPVTTFVSQSATQIVVVVPGATTKGKVTLTAASGVTTQSPADLDVSMPAITTMAPNPVDPETNLTVTGTNLNLVASIAFQNAAPVTSFVSQSATQIVVKVPKGVTEGKLILAVKNSTLTVQSPDILKITGAVPPPVIAFPIYLDAVTSNWNGWTGGWGGSANYANITPVREGNNSIKIDYVGGWGSPLQLGGATVNKGSYTTFKISLYGAPGSGGKTVQLILNGGGSSQSITIVEGKWTDYSFPITSFISGSTITEIWLQETTGSGGFTVYADDIGLN